MQLISVPIVATSLIAGVALTGCGGGSKKPEEHSCSTYSKQADCKKTARCLWANDKCGDAPKTDTCTTHTSQSDCANSGCFWKNGECSNNDPAPVAKDCGTFKKKDTCTADDQCEWSGTDAAGKCQNKPVPSGDCMSHKDQTTCSKDTANKCTWTAITDTKGACTGPPPVSSGCSTHEDSTSCSKDSANKCQWIGGTGTDKKGHCAAGSGPAPPVTKTCASLSKDACTADAQCHWDVTCKDGAPTKTCASLSQDQCSADSACYWDVTCKDGPKPKPSFTSCGDLKKADQCVANLTVHQCVWSKEACVVESTVKCADISSFSGFECEHAKGSDGVCQAGAAGSDVCAKAAACIPCKSMEQGQCQKTTKCVWNANGDGKCSKKSKLAAALVGDDL